MRSWLWPCPILMIGLVAGCASTGETPRPSKPLYETKVLRVGDAEVVGMKLLRADCAPFGYFLRAEHGVVVCTHFDLDGLAHGHTAAAMAKGWTANGIEGELNAKIFKVNALAEAKGGKAGMTVRDALLKLSR